MRMVKVDDWDSFYADLGDSRNMRDSYDMGYTDALDRVDDWMDTQPTIDAVPAVRCKDCVSCYKSESSSTGYRCKCWGVFDTDCECDPNGFCHKGERRNDG